MWKTFAFKSIGKEEYRVDFGGEKGTSFGDKCSYLNFHYSEHEYV